MAKEKPKSLDYYINTQLLSELYSEYYEKEFPFDAFPKVIRDVATTYATSRNLPLEYLCFCACGILSGAMGRAFRAKNALSGDYKQHSNIYVLCVGRSSTGKSASIHSLFSGLEKKIISERLAYMKALKKWEAEMAKTKKLDFDEEMDFESEIGSCENKMPKNPDFIIKNTTSEALVRALAENNGELFSLCEEARDVIAIVAGIYKKDGDDSAVFNSGWCHETIKHNRIINGKSEVYDPCLSLLWMVQRDAVENIMQKKKDTFLTSGFTGRFLFCIGPSKISAGSRIIIPLDNIAIENWENKLLSAYEFRKANNVKWFDTDQDAMEYFYDFNEKNVELQNGRLHTHSELLGKARENAIRLAIIFALAEGIDRITLDIAKRACRVVSYSVCNAINLFSSGFLPKIEEDREKISEILANSDRGYMRISYFDQMLKMNSERVEFIASTFSNLLEILKKGKGRYVVLKSRVNDAKKDLGITETSPTDDDTDPF